MAQSNRVFDQLRQCVRSFLDERRVEGLSPHTLALNERALRPFLVWLEHAKPDLASLPAIDRRVLEDYALHLATRDDDDGRPLKAASRMAYLVSLRAFFAWLEKEGRVFRSPARDLTLPKVGRPVPRGVLTHDEVRRVLRVPDTADRYGLRNRAMVELLYGSGIRRNELVSLRVDDLDLAEELVTVRAGKGGRGRVVPMGAAATHYLRRYLEEARPHLVRPTTDAELFLSRLGRRLSPDQLERVLKEIGRAAGLTRSLTPHGLRHTCGTHLLQGGADVRHIQELLGHKSLTSTQIYTHLAAADLKRVHERCHPRENKHKP